VRHSTLEQRAGGLVSLAGLGSARGSVLAALAVGIAGLAVLFLPEIRAAVETWNASTAYGHCYLVLPMTLYLLWDRRAVIAQIAVRPEPAWALLGLPIAATWLVAERLGIMEGRQLMAIAGFELLFLVVLGWRMFWALSGPLLYLVFLVPFGAFLTPALQRFTADFSIVGLNLLGIPNFADNFVIETPAGTFFVAEACAGLRFLIAAIAFGVFYALLNYRSPVRRLGFIAASIAVPIVANGFRALGIVVLGQILGSAEAAAADHVIYGWVFFSIVMLLLVAAGQLFRESTQPRNAAAAAPTDGSSAAPLWGALASVLLVAAGPAAAAVLDASATEILLTSAPSIKVPERCERPAPAPFTPTTRFRLPVTCGAHVFDVAVTLFPARSTASALVVERRKATQELGAEDVSLAPLKVADAGEGDWTLAQTSEPNRLTAYASWVDGRPARSGLAGRIAQARDSLLGTDYAPVLITISTPEAERAPAQQRRAVMDQMRAFVDAQSGLNDQVARFSRAH
jgi:exosortase A